MIYSKSFNSKTIVCDVDGVLLNWLAPFETWLSSSNMAEVFDFIHNPIAADYELAAKYGITSEQCNALIAVFNSTYHVESLPPIEGAIKYVDKLVRKGYTLHALSSFSSDFASHQMRHKNLVKIYGEGAFSGFTFLPFRSPKLDHLASFRDFYGTAAVTYIDDHAKHVHEAQTAGLPAILFDPDKYFPDEHNKLGVASSWKEIYETITGE